MKACTAYHRWHCQLICKSKQVKLCCTLSHPGKAAPGPISGNIQVTEPSVTPTVNRPRGLLTGM